MPKDDHDSARVIPIFPTNRTANTEPDTDPVASTLAELRAQAMLEGVSGQQTTAHRKRGLAHCVFCTVSKLFRPGRQTSLVESWLPALDGVVERLHRGVRVADLGCNHGHGTLIMAEAFPNSEFVGFDDQVTAVDIARRHAARHGLDNVRFETARPHDLQRNTFELVTCFDWLHAAESPQCVARRVRDALTDNGTWMIVEPGYLADEATGGSAPVDLRSLIVQTGFRLVRQAAETPFNRILEARP